MKYYCNKKSVIRLAFGTKIETTAVVQSIQNLHQMKSHQNKTCCIPWEKILCLSLQTHKKGAMTYNLATQLHKVFRSNLQKSNSYSSGRLSFDAAEPKSNSIIGRGP